VFDLLSAAPSQALLDAHDMILLGGSGHYSATDEGMWLHRALDTLRDVHARRKPTFASCWGFQAMARALGGRVVHDLANAEIGTIELFLTAEGKRDPVFRPLSQRFLGQAGHEDQVVQLPPGTRLLASSDRVANQAYCFIGLPIYCTQFHPELQREDLMSRLRAYPEYVKGLAGMTFQEFADHCRDAPGTAELLPRMVWHFFGS